MWWRGLLITGATAQNQDEVIGRRGSGDFGKYASRRVSWRPDYRSGPGDTYRLPCCRPRWKPQP